MKLKLSLSILLLFYTETYAKVDPILYCDLCKAVVAETRVKISKINPDRKTRIVQGQGRLSSDGNLKTKSKLIPITQSREWLEEVFEEEICKVVAEDYIKWFDGKDKKQWRVGRVMTYDNKMNTDMDMGFLQGGQGEAREIVEKDPNDRTRTIRWYCENTIEMMEEELYEAFTTNKEGSLESNPSKICHDMEWCKADNIFEEFTDEHMQKNRDQRSGAKKEEL